MYIVNANTRVEKRNVRSSGNEQMVQDFKLIIVEPLKFSKSIKLNNKLLKWLKEA